MTFLIHRAGNWCGGHEEWVAGTGGCDREVGLDQEDLRERATRIELAFSAWEADVLPLNYARSMARQVTAPAAAGKAAVRYRAPP